jgi:hypothetical protein
MGICGGAGAAHTPTYTDSLLAVDLFQWSHLLYWQIIRRKLSGGKVCQSKVRISPQVDGRIRISPGSPNSPRISISVVVKAWMTSALVIRC